LVFKQTIWITSTQIIIMLYKQSGILHMRVSNVRWTAWMQRMELHAYFRNQEELLLPAHHQPELLGHINVARRLPRRHLPVKAVHEVRQHDLHGGYPEVHP